MHKVIVASIISTTLWLGPAYAQNFDGIWTGSTGCPAYGPQAAYTERATATITQNQFRYARNTGGVYEIDQGTIGVDGFVSIGGEGQRRDRPLNWTSRFSGQASATTMKLTGTRYEGRPCWIQLTNTQPAPYSLAGIEATNRAARAEAAREQADAAPPQPATPKPQPVAATKPEQQQNNESIRLEEIRRMTNFLLAIKIADAQVLAPDNTIATAVNFGATWQSPNKMGAVNIFLAKPNQTGLTVISELIDADSKTCKGEFASTRWSGLIDSQVIFQADTDCVRVTAARRRAHYFVVPRDKGGFYAYLVLSSGATSQDDQATVTQADSEAEIDAYRKAVVVASVSTDQ